MPYNGHWYYKGVATSDNDGKSTENVKPEQLSGYNKNNINNKKNFLLGTWWVLILKLDL